MREVNLVIERLKEKLNFKTDMELAKYLNLASGTVTNWKNRNKIPYDEIFSICEKENIDINYIFYGIYKNEKININFKDEILNIINNSNKKELEYFYHLLKAEKIKNTI
ncbi:transcriptional regulator, XRE family [Aliarcobacter cibarius]|uniref:helix-turn-helix domain-containing protein n=1 Tax=Aliarcobacter cibarius TaxID=255507 RepID=UPI001244160D|nr:helix-turn-helix domain-containing protein [Aliarcobacter cibarius]QEZ89061.1 transcriptional regulator, XRE family [Aliarcobacter cibarius]